MKYLVLSVLSIGILSLTSCKKENPQLGNAPSGSDVVFTYSPTDTSDNIIDFEASNSGMVNIWDFGNGLKGEGMGEGILKDSVPEAHTDYIIAIISEEYGSIISILIITIFLYIAFRIIKNCVLKNDEFLKLSLCGLASLLIFQTFIHIGVNTSLLPTTGMTLPFLSYGGSSLVGSAISAGIILNFTRKDIARHYKNE